MPAGWRAALEAALDREAEARRDFGRRCEKWQTQRKRSDELRRRQMPPEERRALERKERDARMKAINADLDEREKAGAVRALMEMKSHVRHGRIARVRDLLAGILHPEHLVTGMSAAAAKVLQEQINAFHGPRDERLHSLQ